MAELITVGTFTDPVQAELARARLDAHGVWSVVIEGASFNPMLNAVVGTAVQVHSKDSSLARMLLKQMATPDTEDQATEDEPAEGVVRCPRCELEYCFFERPRLRGGYGASIWALFAVALASAAGKKRWYCHKCEHIWDDPDEGPKQVTRLAPGRPRPIFRLYRGHPGMGVTLGLVAGGLLAVMNPGSLTLLALLVLPVIGWRVGGAIGADVCSEPTCRAPLQAGVEECSQCKGIVAGRIHAAHEHYSAAADVRRELAQLKERPARKKKKRKPRIEADSSTPDAS